MCIFVYVVGECSRAQKKGRYKMDFEKLHELSCSVKTWSEFLLENAICMSKHACCLQHGDFASGFVLRSYENEFYYLKTHMEELILKYRELEKFCDENNIKGD